VPRTEASDTALAYLSAKHLDVSPAFLCGPPHRAAHPARCFFVDPTLWTTPALAPTAVVPTLPESSAAESGFKQLELGDEEVIARYPVLQAVRSGISLDAQSYTRGSHTTIPIVPGAPPKPCEYTRGVDTQRHVFPLGFPSGSFADHAVLESWICSCAPLFMREPVHTSLKKHSEHTSGKCICDNEDFYKCARS
jgi:hypothetical protein